MKICRLLRKLFIKLFKRKSKKVQPKISLLIPFSTNDPVRKASFKWLKKYWKKELPEAEIIIGKSRSKIFCKGEALNNAFNKSTGKVVVVLDSDAYMSGEIINHCADRILEESQRGYPLWYVPYRHLYRLTKDASTKILHSNPSTPLRLEKHPSISDFENTGDTSQYGHRYGAMITIIPREAIETLGCFDERFKGWGGEDVALLRAIDTLYGKHKSIDTSVYHLWHPILGETNKKRIWANQESAGGNDNLTNKYNRATGNPTAMRKLIDDGCNQGV